MHQHICSSVCILNMQSKVVMKQQNAQVSAYKICKTKVAVKHQRNAKATVDQWVRLHSEMACKLNQAVATITIKFISADNDMSINSMKPPRQCTSNILAPQKHSESRSPLIYRNQDELGQCIKQPRTVIWKYELSQTKTGTTCMHQWWYKNNRGKTTTWKDR
jgi:hypothetical protein